MRVGARSGGMSPGQGAPRRYVAPLGHPATRASLAPFPRGSRSNGHQRNDLYAHTHFSALSPARSIQQPLLSRDLTGYPRSIVHRFGFFFLRDGNDGVGDGEHDAGKEDTAGEERGEENEEHGGDSAEAVILKREPIEGPRSSTIYW